MKGSKLLLLAGAAMLTSAVLIVNNGAAPAVASSRPPYPATLHGGSPCGSCTAPDHLSADTMIASDKEPGERMTVSGTIYLADGKTPAAGVVLYVYHTDATGYYNEKDDPSHPRLCGWMMTGSDGHYEFRTIKPAAYPHRTTPAHVHAHVYSAAISEHAIDDYWFAGDPFITDAARAKAREDDSTPEVVTLTRDAKGVLQGTRDIHLR